MAHQNLGSPIVNQTKQMRTFKPYNPKKIKFTAYQNDRLGKLPKGKRKKASKALKKIIGFRRHDAYDKAKLKSSGLWDASAAKKCTLVVTRIEKPVSISTGAIPP